MPREQWFVGPGRKPEALHDPRELETLARGQPAAASRRCARFSRRRWRLDPAVGIQPEVQAEIARLQLGRALRLRSARYSSGPCKVVLMAAARGGIEADAHISE